MELTGWTAEELVFMGDNENDIAMMQLAGCSYCMANGSEKPGPPPGTSPPAYRKRACVRWWNSCFCSKGGTSM